MTEKRTKKSPAPTGIWTHDLKSFALQACALPLCYSWCPNKAWMVTKGEPCRCRATRWGCPPPPACRTWAGRCRQPGLGGSSRAESPVRRQPCPRWRSRTWSRAQRGPWRCRQPRRSLHRPEVTNNVKIKTSQKLKCFDLKFFKEPLDERVSHKWQKQPLDVTY